MTRTESRIAFLAIRSSVTRIKSGIRNIALHNQFAVSNKQEILMRIII